MRAAARRVSTSGIGTSTTATFGLETIFGASSVRFSAIRMTTLSLRSISGRNDQRCSVTTAVRSASL
jgi:hypothetical protein